MTNPTDAEIVRKGGGRVSDYDFGDYVLIEQKRYVGENEMYLHKVIGRSESNAWVDVPVDGAEPFVNRIHKSSEEVISCICCGIDETIVRRYRVSDVKPVNIATDQDEG